MTRFLFYSRTPKSHIWGANRYLLGRKADSGLLTNKITNAIDFSNVPTGVALRAKIYVFCENRISPAPLPMRNLLRSSPDSSPCEALSYQTWMSSIFMDFCTISLIILTRSKTGCSKCSHSIRKQILHRSWCSKQFSTFPKNIFSVDPKMGTSFFRRNHQSSSDFFKVSYV